MATAESLDRVPAGSPPTIVPRVPWSRLAVLAAGALVASGLWATPATAQSDEQAVTAVVTRFFDGMRAKDSAMIRSTAVPGTQLFTAAGAEGLEKPISIDQFVTAISKATGVPNERIKNPTIQVDGPLASLWAYYTFSRGDQLHHCGVDAFWLRKGPDGWKIFSVSDTRRTNGCAAIGT